MVTKDTRSEAELAQYVIAYLRNYWANVYQEVPRNGGSADIVVTRGSILGVVECKRSLTLDVLDQAHRWINYSNLVWCAVWRPKRNATRFGRSVAKNFGIGVLECHMDGTIDEICAPSIRRKRLDSLESVLRPEMMTGEFGKAGTNTGGRFTPFRQTCEAIKRKVIEIPGIDLKTAISLVQHHYASDSSARVCMKDMLEKGVVHGVKYVKEGKAIRLFPA